MLGYPAGQGREHRIVESFRIHRDETLASPQPHHLGAEPGEDADQQVSRHRGMLEHPDAQPAQPVLRQQADKTRHIALRCRRALIGHRHGEIGDRLVAQLRHYAGLVRLADLPVRQVEFEPVAIRRNMAAGDHHRRASRRHGMQRQRRRGDRAAIDRDQPGMRNRRRAIAQDRRARRPQVPSQIDPLARTAGQPRMTQESRDMTAGRLPCQFRRQPAQAAGAEFETVSAHALLPSGETTRRPPPPRHWPVPARPRPWCRRSRPGS